MFNNLYYIIYFTINRILLYILYEIILKNTWNYHLILLQGFIGAVKMHECAYMKINMCILKMKFTFYDAHNYDQRQLLFLQKSLDLSYMIDFYDSL